ncbi:hypothetical protein Bca52824_021359 [Brassica carinata]|uniref:Phorbol-ester/DAG-type domain-containing protein n=1 Tax=Brassica carinata TaxID=52824 RepID=A0A8X8B268_BRACI|nr:hypothetical protein Bca52824_021359 [Brassica carinata]
MTCVKINLQIMSRDFFRVHPLLFSAMFINGKCDGCQVIGVTYGRYFCNEANCFCWFHKDCAESPLEINHHASHPEHPLLLTKMSPAEDGTPCDFCGQEILSTCYNCPTCKFKVDLICGTKPWPSLIEHPVCHDHTLVFLKNRVEEDQVPCELCKEYIFGPSYSCLKCNNVYFHLDCVHLSKEVDHPCHSSHPLKIMPSQSFIDDDDDAQKSCSFCLVQPEKVLYHCSICNFTLCLGCTKRPPPRVAYDAKTHTHPVTLFPSKIKFTCKVAGIEINSYSYICLKCDFIVSGYCVGLPRIININRHDHRISFTHHLGHKGTKCGVCRKSVSQYYGAYSCSICPKYAVHSRCAANFTAWNGVELEGIPETVEDTMPFKVMACVSPIGFGPVYSCQECRFLIHEKCAHLPMKKNLVFGPRPFKLEYHQGEAGYCRLCGIFSGGFKDPDCYMLNCSACGFDLCLYCATLPEKIWHISDEHPLTLYYGGKEATGKNWCEICEIELDSSKWFFTCSDCGVTLHVQCVVGDFSRLTPNYIATIDARPMSSYRSMTNITNTFAPFHV